MAKGFTLIELMIVIAILSILAAVCIAKTNTLIRSAQEARTIGNLKAFRAALNMYVAAHEGVPPTGDPEAVLVPEFLKAIPLKYTPPYHPEGNAIDWGNEAARATSNADWFYYSDPADPRYGQVLINCIHANLKGKVWTTY